VIADEWIVSLSMIVGMSGNDFWRSRYRGFGVKGKRYDRLWDDIDFLLRYMKIERGLQPHAYH